VIKRERLAQLISAEEELFIRRNPKSQQVALSASQSLVSGVPMPWMTRWSGAFPICVDSARGAKFKDIDGNEYVDFCLGDTGSMTGHAVDEISKAIATWISFSDTSKTLPNSKTATRQRACVFRIPTIELIAK